MKNKILSLFLLMILSTSVFAVNSFEPQGNKYIVSVDIKQGWNLVYAFDGTQKINFDSEITVSDIKAIWAFSSSKQEYYNVANNNLETDDTGMWLYFTKSGKLIFTVNTIPTLNQIDLKGGWNIIGISPLFAGHYIYDLEGTCDFQKIYGWDASKQQWAEKAFSSVGFAQAIKVSNDCHLDLNVPSPPALPPEKQPIKNSTLGSLTDSNISVTVNGNNLDKNTKIQVSPNQKLEVAVTLYNEGLKNAERVEVLTRLVGKDTRDYISSEDVSHIFDVIAGTQKTVYLSLDIPKGITNKESTLRVFVLDRNSNEIVKNYKVNVQMEDAILQLTDVAYEWYDSWGKINQLSITIKNNGIEAIKPAYLIMSVEGYGDWNKKIDLPASFQNVEVGKEVTGGILLPSSFAYSLAGVGDVNNVNIALSLHEKNGMLLDKSSNDVDLNGNN